MFIFTHVHFFAFLCSIPGFAQNGILQLIAIQLSKKAGKAKEGRAHIKGRVEKILEFSSRAFHDCLMTGCVSDLEKLSSSWKFWALQCPQNSVICNKVWPWKLYVWNVCVAWWNPLILIVHPQWIWNSPFFYLIFYFLPCQVIQILSQWKHWNSPSCCLMPPLFNLRHAKSLFLPGNWDLDLEMSGQFIWTNSQNKVLLEYM